MSSNEINLIQDKITKNPVDLKIRSFIDRFTIYFLVIFAVVLLLVMGVYLLFAAKQKNIENKIVAEKNQINNLQQNEAKYILLKQRVTILNKIFSNRYNYTEIYNFFKKLDLDGNEIRTINISESGNVTVSLKTTDTNKLDEIINIILKDAQLKFKKIVLTNTVFYPQTGYEITFAIETNLLKNYEQQ